MSNALDLVTINQENISDYPGLSCFMNPRQEGAQTRKDWMRDRLSEGLTLRLLTLPGTKKTIGCIEYVPGEYAWRAVDAKGYMFIHCIWVSPNVYRGLGNATRLVQACINDAKRAGKPGAAVIASEGPFMAGSALFQKNGFSIVEEVPPSYSLLAYTLKDGPPPKIRDWRSRLAEYDGLNLVYASQCPWVARSVGDISKIASELGLMLQVTELKTASEAQDAPSVYGIFSLIFNGTLLADHYISPARFRNIVRKDILGEKKKSR